MKSIIKQLFNVTVITLLLVLSSFNCFAASEKSIVAKVAELGGLDNETAAQQFSLVFNAIKEELKAGNEVVIKKFGKFEVQQRSERNGRNPKTGAAIKIPAKRYVHFKSYDSLKDEMNPGVGKAQLIEETSEQVAGTTEN
ncbi:MAG: HU family DNA-binding protein [Deltaproteobacteria bacterium]|jgi:nucleoid DNA-binding protein|nr:HU family DNA-binding protein [Deltaproteobacteria bacterium]